MPVLQWVELPADEVNSTESPVQKVRGPDAVMEGADGIGNTVTETGVEAALRQPFDLALAVNAPEDATVIEEPISPLDHKELSPAELVKVTEPPSQNEIVPEEVMVGARGVGSTTTDSGALTELVQDPITA